MDAAWEPLRCRGDGHGSPDAGRSGRLQAVCSIPTGSREKAWKRSSRKLEGTVSARGLLSPWTTSRKGRGSPGSGSEPLKRTRAGRLLRRK